MLELKKDVKAKKLETYLPRKDFILLTGKIEVLGIELFCGSVVYDNENGLEFAPCQVLAPDPILYNKLNEKQIGDVIQITKTRVRNSKLLKNDFKVIDVIKTEEIIKQSKPILDGFDAEYYKQFDLTV